MANVITRATERIMNFIFGPPPPRPRRTIQTLWFWRKGESSPELLVAWDDYSVDENPDGFEAECVRTYDQVRSSDAFGPRRITLSVDEQAIADAFAPPTVRSIVESS